MQGQYAQAGWVWLFLYSICLAGLKRNEPACDQLDQSRHVQIELSCLKPGFRHTKKNCELVGNPSIQLEARLKLVGHPGFRPGFK